MLAYAQHKFNGDQGQAEDVFKKIAAANKLVPGTGGRALVNSTASGEIDIDMSCVAHVYVQLKAQGAPLGITKQESVPEPVGIAIMKGAPHPATATLVARWLLSDAGQKAIVDMNRIPANPNFKAHVDVSTQDDLSLAPAVVSDKATKYAADWKQIFDLH
jgi:ABC-type Fe3+ transport system substrate-binding protein